MRQRPLRGFECRQSNVRRQSLSDRAKCVPTHERTRIVEIRDQRAQRILTSTESQRRERVQRLTRFIAMLPDHPRFAFEFRHDSWLIPSVCDVLRTRRIALCIPDHPKMPQMFEITSDFTYIRMHLPSQGLGYGKRALQSWAERAAAWSARGLDVFVYFNNDMEGHAIEDAQTLKELVTRASTELGRR